MAELRGQDGSKFIKNLSKFLNCAFEELRNFNAFILSSAFKFLWGNFPQNVTSTVRCFSKFVGKMRYKGCFFLSKAGKIIWQPLAFHNLFFQFTLVNIWLPEEIDLGYYSKINDFFAKSWKKRKKEEKSLLEGLKSFLIKAWKHC